jgi:predicted transcriptional regulator
MRTVTLNIASLDEAKVRLRAAFKGKKQGARISFATPELLLQIMTMKRWELLLIMIGAGPLTIRGIGRALGRDVKAVHGDVRALLNAGILRKTAEGLIVFPFDDLHLDAHFRPQARSQAA